MKVKLKGGNSKDIIELICDNRGVEVRELQDFIHPTKASIQNPLVYDNMAFGCSTILEAIQNNKKIGVLFDSDADGYTSGAMMVNYLREVHGYAKTEIFMHKDKTHGLTKEIMFNIANRKVDLLIVPDASSEDYIQHKELKDSGITVIVIDHHEAEHYSENAIVINNQLSSQGNKTLSGAGMVLKVIEYMDILTGKSTAEDYYDLASVGLVGDIMLMTEAETRYYVQQGLRNLRNPLIQELFTANSDMNFETISFCITPVINAFIRVGTFEEKIDLLKALIGYTETRPITIKGMGEVELELPAYIARIGGRIKKRQADMTKATLENEQTKIYTEDLPITVCILNEEANRNLTGLIGNKLVDMYNKPAIVVKEVEEGLYRGSGRSTSTFDFFKDYINSMEHFEYGRGHQGAFGVGVTKDNLERYLEDSKGTGLGENADVYFVDKIYIDTVSAYEIMQVDTLKNEWAKGFDKPQFYIDIQNVNNTKIEVVGSNKDTIKIIKDFITYIKFKCSKEEVKAVKNGNINRIQIIGSFSMNEWNDRQYPQVIVDKLELTYKQASVTEVVPDVGFANFRHLLDNNQIKW